MTRVEFFQHMEDDISQHLSKLELVSDHIGISIQVYEEKQGNERVGPCNGVCIDARASEDRCLCDLSDLVVKELVRLQMMRDHSADVNATETYGIVYLCHQRLYNILLPLTHAALDNLVDPHLYIFLGQFMLRSPNHLESVKESIMKLQERSIRFLADEDMGYIHSWFDKACKGSSGSLILDAYKIDKSTQVPLHRIPSKRGGNIPDIESEARPSDALQDVPIVLLKNVASIVDNVKRIVIDQLDSLSRSEKSALVRYSTYRRRIRLAEYYDQYKNVWIGNAKSTQTLREVEEQ